LAFVSYRCAGVLIDTINPFIAFGGISTVLCLRKVTIDKRADIVRGGRSPQKKNAAEATTMICAAYAENAVSHTTCKNWYQKFCQENFSLEDEPRVGCPQKIETDELQALDINSAQTEKLADQFGITASYFPTFTYDGNGSEGRHMGFA